MKRNIKILITLLILILVSCKGKAIKQNEARIFNYQNEKDLIEYNKLNLDDTHPNLLNPSASKDKVEENVNSFQKLNRELGIMISIKKFNFNIPDNTIRIFHRYYFDKEGKIKYCLFKFKNKIDDKTATNYKSLLREFTKDRHIELKYESQFAQCGTSKFVIKSNK